MSREYTNKLIELCDDGLLSKERVFDELMSYLSEYDIKDFCIEGFAGEIEGYFKHLEE